MNLSYDSSAYLNMLNKHVEVDLVRYSEDANNEFLTENTIVTTEEELGEHTRTKVQVSRNSIAADADGEIVVPGSTVSDEAKAYHVEGSAASTPLQEKSSLTDANSPTPPHRNDELKKIIQEDTTPTKDTEITEAPEVSFVKRVNIIWLIFLSTIFFHFFPVADNLHFYLLQWYISRQDLRRKK